MGDKDFAALQQGWFRQLTTCGAVTSAGFTALLAGLGFWLNVRLLLLGGCVVGVVFLLTMIALALAATGRLLQGAQLLAGGGVAHAVVQSYLFPFAAPALAVSVVLSVASVLPYVHGRPLRWLVVTSILSSLAIASIPLVSPLPDVVPRAAQEAIGLAALPAVTIMTALLLLQFSERIRYTREAEAVARADADEARHALETATERLRLGVSAAGIGIWDVDLVSGKLAMDDRCRTILGIPAGEQLNYAEFLAIVHADDRQYVHDSVSQIVSAECDGKYEIEYRVRGMRDDGAARWIHSTGQRLSEGGRFIRLIGTARDVTADKANETELRTARYKAEDANRAKDQFLAMLGHELRNPLAPMLTALELLRVRLGEAGAREREVIHRQVRNLAQLVDDLLDVAQIRKGRMALEKTSIYARQIVALACDVVSPMLEERRHRLEIDIQPPALILVGDERRLVQALTNLLTNAVKYTEPGGSIRVSVVAEGDEIALSVRDTGRGISGDLLPHVFDLFVQGERTPDRREGGLGLGLPIVRSIVERHGGAVSVTSDGVGKGSEFLIRLPATGTDTPLPAVRSVTARASSNEKVLIIDDNTDAADSLCALLRDSGFTCASALDGPSGLNTVTSFGPDVILLDLGLPGLDGYEVARRIRAMPDGDRYLIIALTGYGEDRDRRRSTEAGFDAHLVKPVELEQILSIVRAPPQNEGLQLSLTGSGKWVRSDAQSQM